VSHVMYIPTSPMPEQVRQWINDFGQKVHGGADADTVAHSLVMMGITVPGYVDTEDEYYSNGDASLRWIYENKEYYRWVVSTVFELGQLAPVIEVLARDLDAVNERLPEYGHIVHKPYGRHLLRWLKALNGGR
jgi:hypothetical protein